MSAFTKDFSSKSFTESESTSKVERNGNESIGNRTPANASSKSQRQPRKGRCKEKETQPTTTSMLPKKRKNLGECIKEPPKKVKLVNSIKFNRKNDAKQADLTRQMKLSEIKVVIVPLKMSKTQDGKVVCNSGVHSIKITQNNVKSDTEVKESEPIIDLATESNSTNIIDNEKCDLCGQFINNSDLIYYQGHPQDSVEECVALANEKLALSAGNEGDVVERPNTNITGFSIYDKNGHLCPLDCGLLENKIVLYMSGYLKSISSDSPDIDEECVPIRDVGPIVEWYTDGFDGGIKNYIKVSTEFGEYNLLKPSAEYAPYMDNLNEKIWLSKVVIEYLQENSHLQPTYEDLLEVIQEATIPEFEDKQLTEEILYQHAQFVCDQMVSIDIQEDYVSLITLPCIRTLVKLMGIKFEKRNLRSNIVYKKVNKKKALTKATTTPLIRKTFERFFANQLDKTNHELLSQRKSCGICEACQLPDCGKCNACRAMTKFGGQGTTMACVRKTCPNMAVQESDDSDSEEKENYQMAEKKKKNNKKNKEALSVMVSRKKKNIVWYGQPVQDTNKEYYDSVRVDNLELQAGDYVMVASKPNIPALVVRLAYMYKDNAKPTSGYFHGEAFIRSSDTVLGEVGNPREIFVGKRRCFDAPLSSILRKAIVERKDTPTDWFQLGGQEIGEQNLYDDGKTYFYNKYYDKVNARFEDIPADFVCPNKLRKHRFCSSCARMFSYDYKDFPRVSEKIAKKSVLVKETNRTEWTSVKYQDHDYKKGCGVFLKRGVFKLKKKVSVAKNDDKTKLEKVNEDVYPEYYRKSNNNMRGSNADTRQPYCVGCIAAVTAVGDGILIPPQDIYLKVNVLYRPENTSIRFPYREDLNIVYWSDEIKDVPFSAVVGHCNLVYEKNIPLQYSIDEWLQKDPNNFYFRMAYDTKSSEFIEVPDHARNIGRIDIEKYKCNGNGKEKSNKPNEPDTEKKEETNIRPLRTMDVFAGCGGLSEGLHQAGIANCRWAIENVESAANAYSINNRSCTVYIEDCNALLKDVVAGATHTRRGLRLPMKGEVELICGGPPCQGFSGMNRFNSREYSNFKNSLVASFLSYCDYYRPIYFILENVRNFVAFKKGMVLKLTLRALLEMGYQCTFGVLQAGNFGVPQTRRRLVVLAAAPGYKLPLYPKPTHAFNKRACTLLAYVDGKQYRSNNKLTQSAPMRTCTIRDAMSDLPHIPNGANKMEMKYSSKPGSHFQRMMRSLDETAKLRDHICKNMAPLIQARISRIPTRPGSDWRDLPNISVTLSDGNKCKVLEYRYEDAKNGRSSTGAKRGVCACAERGSRGVCSRDRRQDRTLIPWCLPHTANRNNNWAGLYGRLEWEGFFSTTVTDPEPMGKQGRVLHPDQPRVVSVRECARSQGFHDTYRFAGSVQDKHRQIGNAVPPPLSEALGREIKKALAASDKYLDYVKNPK